MIGEMKGTCNTFLAKVLQVEAGRLSLTKTPRHRLMTGCRKESGSYLLSHLVGQYHRRW